ncbi:MAG TPA: CheR family methyltransferase [Solirubrobacteraceae bacterium]|nr:CheR family methyltransferase [Solirubrobacteraceae bacterium]
MPEPGGRSEDERCVAFLQWALPHLGLQWAGYRKVRRQVCRRLRRRLRELEAPDLDAYRDHLAAHPEEWAALDALTPITISRFHRDRGVFERLERDVLPGLAAAGRRDRDVLRAWSAGCASGEEPYTLALLWNEALARRFPALRLEILATDVEPAMLRRARAATYGAGSLRELPEPLRHRGFTPAGAGWRLRAEHRDLVTLAEHDLRGPAPAGPFDLVLCRNVAFTYLAPAGRRAVLTALTGALRPGGALVIGLHESLPDPHPGLEPWPGARAIHRRV